MNKSKNRTFTRRFHSQKMNLLPLLGNVRFPLSFTHFMINIQLLKLLKVKSHSKFLSNWPLVASGRVTSCDNEPFIRTRLMHYLFIFGSWSTRKFLTGAQLSEVREQLNVLSGNFEMNPEACN